MTIEGLLNLKPWQCRQWYTTKETRNPRSVARIEIASEATRRKGPYRYAAVTWYRGFLHSVHQISPQALFRYVESGQHAWHPWTFGKSDSTQGEHWLSLLEEFTSTGFPTPSTEQPGYYFSISYRDRQFPHSPRSKWHAGDDSPVNAMHVVPYPIARLLKCGPTLAGERRRLTVSYPTAGDAISNLNQAMRSFVFLAAQRARQKVIERGGTA